jgi:hypothetical protein
MVKSQTGIQAANSAQHLATAARAHVRNAVVLLLQLRGVNGIMVHNSTAKARTLPSLNITCFQNSRIPAGSHALDGLTA